MFAMFYFASIYLQEVRGYSPIQAGLAFVPFTFGIVIGAGAAQALVQRLGAWWTPVIALVVAVVGELLFVRLTVHGGYFSQLFPGIVVMSIGMGLTFVPLTMIATTNIAHEDAGLASGLFNTSQQVGGALGLAILSTLAASRTSHLVAGHHAHPDALVSGFHVAFAVGAGLMALGLVVMAVLLRPRDVANVHVGEAAIVA
jgi:MFS family permease